MKEKYETETDFYSSRGWQIIPLPRDKQKKKIQTTEKDANMSIGDITHFLYYKLSNENE